MKASYIWPVLAACWLTALSPTQAQPGPAADRIITGAEQLDVLVRRLHNKRVALMVNATSLVGKTNLADTLKALHVGLVKLFSPEHGFRGTADAGEQVTDGVDPRTGLQVISLYGANRKPTPEQMSDVDVVIFDIQDVGVRFYTYISSLHYLMDACAEQKKKFIVLDRPNPNGSFVDGPVLLPAYQSFVGVDPLPIAYGLTIGELARMINGEHWLESQKNCDLEIITLKNYTHDKPYSLPVRPSPNLPNDHAIAMYPSICLFEGTIMSVGRGTPYPFEVVGHPALKNFPYKFTPVSTPGMDKKPLYENQSCFGLDLRNETPPKKISLQHLIEIYRASPDRDKFFTPYFLKLVGTNVLEQQIRLGLSEEEIRATWQPELTSFRKKRSKYVLYP